MGWDEEIQVGTTTSPVSINRASGPTDRSVSSGQKSITFCIEIPLAIKLIRTHGNHNSITGRDGTTYHLYKQQRQVKERETIKL